MEWLNNGVFAAVVGFLSSATGTALITFFARSVIRGAKKVLTDKDYEFDKLRNEAVRLQAENKDLSSVVKQIADEHAKLYEICKTAFLNDPKLVANGAAEKISKIVNKKESA
jgi:cell division protein FtsL